MAAARDHGGHPGGGGDHALVQEVELQGDSVSSASVALWEGQGKFLV